MVGFESPKLHQKIPSIYWGFFMSDFAKKSFGKSFGVDVFVLLDDAFDFVLRVLRQFANDSAKIIEHFDCLVFAVTRITAHAGVPTHAVARCVHASACVYASVTTSSTC